MTDGNSSNLPAVRAASGILTAAAAGSIFDPAALNMRLFTSFPEAEAGKVFELIQTSTGSLSDLIGKRIAVQHIVAHSVEIVDQETGEVQDADRIVLVTPEGESYSCVSNGVRRSLQQIMALTNSMPPWDPAMVLDVKQKNTRLGRRTYILTPVNYSPAK